MIEAEELTYILHFVVSNVDWKQNLKMLLSHKEA